MSAADGGNGKKRKREKKEPAKKDKKPRGVSRSRKKKEQPDLLNYRQMYALSKKERVSIYAILCERIASPKELSHELGEGLSQISYHVRVLRECGLIKEDHRVPRRGAVEHFYRSLSATLIPPKTWDRLPPAVRKGISTSILQEFYDDANLSLEADSFDEEPGELSWTPLLLDDQGVEEFGEISREFIDSILALQKRVTQRQPKRGKAKKPRLTSATAFLASFISARKPENGKKGPATRRR